MQFTLPELEYGYDGLEPFISARALEIHHAKHHQAYLNNLNALLQDLPQFEDMCPKKIAESLDQVPADKVTAFRNNLGGYINHRIFFKSLKKGTVPHGNLKVALEEKYGSIDNFLEAYLKAAATQFGSGWAWLVLNEDKELEIVATLNQGNPLMGEKYSGVKKGLPILCVDVWEHSYYLDYQNRRAEYLEQYKNILNWDFAEKRFNHVTQK